MGKLSFTRRVPREGDSRASRRPRRLAALAAGLLVGTVPVLVAVIAPAASGTSAMVAIGGTPRAPAGAQKAGAMPAGASVSGMMVLKPRDQAGLQQFIGQVTDPRSPTFHQYLPAGAFASRFGPKPGAVDAVRAQLRAAGLRVDSVSSNGLFVNFSGTATTVEHAFRTGLTSYRLARGATGRATTSPPLVPSAIAGDVTAILGLDELVPARPAAVLRPPAADRGKIKPAVTAGFAHPAGSPTPCQQATAAAQSFGGLTDDQIANAYGAFGLYGAGDLGAGQRIGLYELEPFARSDIRTFDTCYFGATATNSMLSRLKVIPVDGGQPTGSGSGESNLDVEDISALAPGAGIDVYTGKSPGANGLIYDPIDPYVAMVDADRDQVISTSWGLCEQAIQAGQPGLQESENLVFEQAAAQGQTVLDASGDNGSDDCNTNETSTPVSGQNPLSIDDPSGQPYVLSVGGTSITDAATSRPTEQVWNDGSTEGAAGGGISESWTMPAWQRQTRVPGMAFPGGADYAAADKVESAFGYPSGFCLATVSAANAKRGCRTVPDVAAQADQFTGAITVYQATFGGWGTAGGTSSSAPIWAAMLAVANASAACAAAPATSHGAGFAIPLLYQIASQPDQYKASFNDVTAGNNDIYGLGNGLVFGTHAGYDLASGLGTPRLSGPGDSPGLAFYLCNGAAQTTRPVVSALSPRSGSTSGGTTLTITGSGFQSGSDSNVAAVQLGSLRIGAGALTVMPSSITFAVPAASRVVPPRAPAPQDGAGPEAVVVLLKNGASSAPTAASIFQYVDTSSSGTIPTVTGVVPVGGSATQPGPVILLGSGFHGAEHVAFGGVAAPGFKVDGPNRITVTPPRLSPSTACLPLPKSGVYANENAQNDICQAQVTVTNANGTSPTSRIRHPFEGPFQLDVLDVLEPPPGCGCETMQAPTEYDYAPAPKVTSISTSNGPASLASEKGGTVITVRGSGLNPLTINWADIGDAGHAAAQDVNYVFVSGTKLELVAPGKPRTTSPASYPFSVNTLAGQSNTLTLQYAGVPVVDRVVNLANSTTVDGVSGAPDTGGTPIRISGQGFQGQVVAPIRFDDAGSGVSNGTQYSFTIQSDAVITTQTVQQNPAVVDVRVCTVTGCSGRSPSDELILYPPGDPSVSSASPTSGPAAGGTSVSVRGANLGCVVAVFFGNAKSPSASQVPSILDCGSTTQVKAKSPPGTAGASVPVTVETAESVFTGSGHSATKASFTYK